MTVKEVGLAVAQRTSYHLRTLKSSKRKMKSGRLIGGELDRRSLSTTRSAADTRQESLLIPDRRNSHLHLEARQLGVAVPMETAVVRQRNPQRGSTWVGAGRVSSTVYRRSEQRSTLCRGLFAADLSCNITHTVIYHDNRTTELLCLQIIYIVFIAFIIKVNHNSVITRVKQ